MTVYADILVHDLLKAGSDVNAADNKGWTPLMHAVLNSDSKKEMQKQVSMLLTRGVNVHAEREDADEGGKWTALMYALSGPGKRFLPEMIIKHDLETLVRANRNFAKIDAGKPLRRSIQNHSIYGIILEKDEYSPDGRKYEPMFF